MYNAFSKIWSVIKTSRAGSKDSDIQPVKQSESETHVEDISRYSNPTLDRCLNKSIDVGRHGFIRVIDYMGGDQAVTQAARVSYGKGTKSIREDESLIRYLMSCGHWSPFEMAHIKLHVKLPIFVARQWIRHKFHLNEYSARYSKMSEDYYLPDLESIGSQSKSNKQGTNVGGFSKVEKEAILEMLEDFNDEASSHYEVLLETGLSRELARTVKPLSSYTEWYMETNLRDLLHFVRQRSDSHAQSAIREYSDVIRDQILPIWAPASHKAFMDYINDSVSLSGPEIRLLKHIKESKDTNVAFNCSDYNMTKREVDEALQKFKDIGAL